MAQILIRHRVDHFASWKAIFDEHRDRRRASGERGYRLYQVEGDANNVVVIFEWDEMENAHAFFESAELRDAMERAGVAETPEIHFMNEAESGSTQ